MDDWRAGHQKSDSSGKVWITFTAGKFDDPTKEGFQARVLARPADDKLDEYERLRNGIEALINVLQGKLAELSHLSE